MPGCPLPTFCTESMARTRTVSTARSSSSVQSRRASVGTSVGSSHQRHASASSLVRRWSCRSRRSVRGPGASGDMTHRVCTPFPFHDPPAVAQGRRRRGLVTALDSEVSVRGRISGTASARDVLGAYVGLTKPRVIELLLLTTVPVMFFAQRGVPPFWLVVATVVGGTLSAGSANALNCVYDRDIDEQMRRTRRRALPRHIVTPRCRSRLRAGAGGRLDAGARASSSTGSRPGWRSRRVRSTSSATRWC